MSRAASGPAAHAYDRTADGEWAVAGASSHDGYRGAAYVYHRSGLRWVLDATLTPSERGPFARFGASVAIDGNTLVIGAPWDDGWKGAAYVYERSAGAWSLTSRIAPLSVVGDRFGSRVSFSDGVVSLGAESGGVARYRRSQSGWTEVERVADGSASLVTGRMIDAGLQEAVATQDAQSGAPGQVQSPMAIDPPATVRATDGEFEDRTQIRWSAVSGGPFLYKIYRRRAADLPAADVLIRVASQDDLLYSDATGAAGHVYTYSVRVLDMANAEGAATSDNGHRSIFAPDGFTASDATSESVVRLRWSDRSNIETGYRIRRNGTQIAQTAQSSQIYNDETAVPGTIYTYSLVAFDAAGDSTAPVTDDGRRALIAAPLAVSASDGEYTDKVAITWVDNTALEANYRVYRDGALRMTLPAGTQSFDDVTASPGTPYEYCVAAVDPFDVESARGCDFGGIGVLPPPANVTATDAVFDNKVTIAWQDTSDTEDGFRVYRMNGAIDAVLVEEVNAGVTTSDDLSGQPGQTYSYCVVAFSDLGGSSVSACDDGQRAVVTAPGSVKATDGLFEDHVDITWESASTSAVLYKIYRGGVFIRSVAGNSRTYSDQGVPSGTPTTYGVSAVSALGVESAPTTDIGSRTIVVPGSVTASDNAFENRVALSWTDGSLIEDGFFVFRRLAGTADPLERIAIRPSNANGFDDLTGVPGKTYDYRVTAFQAYGVDDAETTESQSGGDSGVRALVPPAFVSATDGAFEDKIVLTWVDNSRYEEAYHIWRRNTATNDSARVAVLPPNSNQYEDLSIVFGTFYEYSVLAADSSGTQLIGTSAAGKDLGSTAILPPSAVSASEFYTNKVVVAWFDESARETAYEIRRNDVVIGSVPANATSFTDLGAVGGLPVAGTNYSYCVWSIAATASSAQVCDSGMIPGVRSGDQTSFAFTDATGSNVSDDLYGSDISGDGERLIIGAPESFAGLTTRVGKVFVMRRTASGLVQEQVLAPPIANAPLMKFGERVALEGTSAIVATPGSSSRSAYFFERNPISDVWTQTQTVVTGGQGNGPAMDVDIDGEWAVVSSAGLNSDRGGVLFFQRQGTSWAQMQNLERNDPEIFKEFGASVAISGGAAIVGALRSDGEVGAAYIFTRNAQGVWSQAQKLPNPNPGTFVFGVSVDIDGDLAVVGANYRGVPPFTPGGFAYVFERGGNGVWQQVARLEPEPAAIEPFYAASVAIRGETILVGAPGFALFNGETPGPGAVYHYARKDGQWSRRQVFPQRGAGPRDLGSRVALLDGVLLAGTLGDDTFFGGAVYMRPIPVTPEVMFASDGVHKDKVQVEWSDNSEAELGFKVYRDGQLIATTNPDIRAYADLDADPGQTHEYCVAAFDAAFESDRACDFGRRPPNGNITGRVATGSGAGVNDTQVCLDPTPNRALLFDGVGGTMTVPDGGVFGTAFTVEFWYRGYARSGQKFVQYSTASTPDAVSLLAADPGFPTPARVNGLEFPLWGLESLNNGAWHHVAFQWTSSSGVITLHFDGAPAYTSPATLSGGYVPPSDGTLVFGGGGLSGAMDDIRVWDHIRTQAQIQESMLRPLTGKETGLAAYWPLDEYQAVGAEELVGNRYGLLSSGARWVGEAAPLVACAVSDDEGNYVLPNLRYGTSTTFKLTPMMGGHQFTPAFKTITLSTGSPVQNEVGFTDITAFTVSGAIRYGTASCYAADVPVFVDGVPRGATDGNGRYSIPVSPGNHTIEARKDGHSFSPAILNLVGLAGDLGGQNITDVTVRHLTGAAAGGCGIPIGTLRISVNSEDRCYSEEFDVSGAFDLALPPLKYFVRLVDVPVAGGVDPASVIQFFDRLGVREADLSQQNKVVDFKYRAPVKVTIDGLPAAGCLGVPVLPQSAARYPLTIRVVEDYGNNQTCDVDTGFVTVFDEIIDQEDTPVTLVVKDGQAYLPIGNDLTRYTTAANNPNIFAGRIDGQGQPRDYQKSLSVVAEVPGQDASTRTVWAIVTGHRPRTAEFTAESQGIPLLVLHDPPGDNSFSFVKRDSQFCTTISNIGLQGTAGEFTAKAKVGLRMALGVFVMTALRGQIDTEGGLKVGFEATQGNEVNICATTTEEFKTSSDHLFIGRDGDVYVGLSLNLLFAKTDIVEVRGCGVETSVGVTFGVDRVKSVYSYTDWNIRNTIIPQLAELADLAPNRRARYESAAANWQAHLDMNDSLLAIAPVEQNRSFSAGADYTYSSTVDTSRAFNWSVKVYTTATVSTGFDFEIAGNEAAGEYKHTFDFSYQRAQSTTVAKSRTTGYTLADDDIGDVFSVNVKKDLVYGTPMFDLVAGRSSCPWEPWYDAHNNPRSQSVDEPQLSVEPNFSGGEVPAGTPASFTINMTNATEAGQLREYLLYPVQESNPDGAIIKINGIVSPGGVSFFIPAGETYQATVTVEQGPVRAHYDDLKIALVAPCELDLFRDGGAFNLTDEATFSVHFDSPCSDITLVRPEPGWTIRAGSRDTLDLRLAEFELADRGLAVNDPDTVTVIGAQYLDPVLGWLPIAEVSQESARDPEGNPASVLIKWPVTGVPDGTYSIRAYTSCASGKAYSGTATGVIDRSSPQVLGTPNPSDLTLSLGEDVSITFNEIIDCINPASYVLLEDITAADTLGMNVTCDGRTLVIVPTLGFAALEGHVLRATVAGVKDKAGNLSGARAWTFSVRQGEFAWQRPSLSQDVGFGSGGRIALDLANGLSLPVSYTISTLPAWLSLEPPSTNTIAEKSTAPVVFLISETAALGAHDTTITATATTVPPTFPRSTQIAVHVDVQKVPPGWAVNPADYEPSMTVRAKVIFTNGDSSASPEDILAAFVGDQVRGVAHPQLVSDGWRYFLTVYGKPPAFERVRFRVWDSRTSRTYIATDRSLKFSPDMTYGSFANPFEIRTRQPSPANEQITPVNAGWTWFSVNRRPSAQDDRTVAAVLSNLIPAPGDLVKAQDGSMAMFDAEAGWIGTLDSLGVTESYRLRSAAAGVIRYESTRVLPSAFPMTVKRGWNWIGFTPDTTRSVATALANYSTAAVGDILRSQAAFAEYGPSIWAGSLDTMGPGLGYALYRSDPTDDQFGYSDTNPVMPILAGIAGSAAETQPEGTDARTSNPASTSGLPGWEVDYRAYQYDMVVTARITGIALGPQYQVAAVVAGEVRGVAKPVHVAALDRTLVFLMVRSNQPRGETVHFQALDRSSGKVYEVAGTITFEADAVMGSTASPVPLTSDGVVIMNLGLPEAFELGSSYPNPMLGAGKAIVRYGLPTTAHVSLDVFDVSGRRVQRVVNATQPPGWYDVAIEPGSLKGGIYFYRMRAGAFSATRRMVVVR